MNCEGAFFIRKTCDDRGLCESYECNRMKSVCASEHLIFAWRLVGDYCAKSATRVQKVHDLKSTNYGVQLLAFVF